MITGDGILGWEFFIDGSLGKSSVMGAVSTIINFVIISAGVFKYMGDCARVTPIVRTVSVRSGVG